MRLEEGSWPAPTSLRRAAWTLAFILACTGCGKSGTRGCSDFWGCDPGVEPFPDPDWGPADEIDLGPGDAGLIFGPDSSVECTDVIGAPCTVERGCRVANAVCLAPEAFGQSGIGDPFDPLLGHPDGPDAFVPIEPFSGGYCTTSFPAEGESPDHCNVLATGPDPLCGECGRCVAGFYRESPAAEAIHTGFVPGFCAVRCSPSVTTNGCRDGYDCDLQLEVCLLGCQSDDECRIAREDTNGVPGLQTPYECDFEPELCTPDDCESATPADPEACANPASNADPLVYDTESTATCDPMTARCVDRPSDPDASGGDPCTEDAQCEPGGRCIEETEDGRWLGGSCTKDRCDLEGNECANGGSCGRLVGTDFTIPACLLGCTVGGYDGSAPASWIADGSARTTCREGYGCQWNGDAPGGEPNNGVCTPVDYEPAVTAPNVSATCESDADCWSPFGQGECSRDAPGFDTGYCTVRGCNAPWLTEGDVSVGLCGDGADCFQVDPADPANTLCARLCTTGDDCRPGLGCVDFTTESKACWGWCESSADCRSDEICARAGTDDAHCVPRR